MAKGRRQNPRSQGKPLATPASHPDAQPLGPGTPQQQARATVFSQEAYFHAGPLPPPEVLSRYNDVIPNGAERILVMAEEQARHRQYLEKTVIKSDIRRSYLGLGAGFVVTLVFGSFSYFLIQAGHDVAGTVLGTADLATLAGLFIYGGRRLERERTEKAKIMTGQ